MVRGREHPRTQGFLVMGLVALVAASIPARAPAQPPLQRYDRVDVEVADYPLHVETGDLNGDGRGDIVAPGYLSATLSILRQDAAGGFDRQDIAVDENPGEPEIANLDADADEDIAVPFEQTDRLGILRQQGGSFVRTNVAVGDIPTHVALGDLERDGDVDAVVTNLGDDSISVLRQGAGGGFVRTDLPVGARPTDVVLTDLDGDSDRDIAVSTIFNPGIVLFFRQASGLFARSTHALPSGANAVAAGDIDGDRDVDLLAADPTVSETLWVLRRDGPGASYTRIGLGNQLADHVELTDIDSDGDLDVALARSLDDGPRFLLNDGSGQFTPGVAFVLSWGGLQDYAIEDLNGDGRLDIAVADTGNPNDRPPTREIAVLTDSGKPVPKCGGRTPTEIGTNGDERTVVQGPGGAVVALLGGSDRHSVAREERVTVCGGAGADKIDVFGPPVSLRLFGEGGDDVLAGGRRNDLAVGGGGDDKARGGGGNDRLRGNAGKDKLTGEKGEDRANGGKGRDRCRAERVSGCER